MAPIGAHRSGLVKLGREGGAGSGRAYLRQDAAVARRQGWLRYGRVVGSWVVYGRAWIVAGAGAVKTHRVPIY